MTRFPPIVVLSPCPWDTHYFQFYKSVFADLSSRGHEVVWVDDRIRLRRDGLAKWLRTVGRGELTRPSGMWRFRPWTINRFKLGERFTTPERIHAWTVRRALRRLDLSSPIVVLFTPRENEVARRVRPKHLVFWTGDEMTWPGTDWLVDHADAILALSQPTFDEMNDRRPGVVHRFPTGVESDVFVESTGSCPAELQELSRPIFGYVGNIASHRVDFNLIRTLAEENPDASVVLMGPLDTPSNVMRSLPPNVVVLPERPYAQVPTYLAHFDVGLIPYLHTAFNVGSSPLKLHEYLAIGLPVVGTSIPSVVEYSDVVSVADEPLDFAHEARRLAGTRHERELVARRQQRVAAVSSSAMAERMSAVFAELS